MNTEEVRGTDLAVGDTIVLWCGTKRVVAIEPYRGPLADIVVAIATYAPGGASRPTGAISICKGDYFTRVVFATRGST